MNVDERLAIVKRNTQEIITEEELKSLLERKKAPVVYIGISITGQPHVGYFLWVTKVADFVKAGFKVKILLADIHGSLDNTPWELLEKRYKFYKEVITGLFEATGADLKKLEFVKGSEFQLKKEYMLDVLKMATVASVHDCKRAASEVVKMGESPKLSGLMYPIMQSLDEQYLKVDVQYGGLDQRKILVFAREYLPKLGYEARVEVMTPLIPGLLEGGKMSSSVKGSKIGVLDDEKTVQKKINGAYCVAGKAEGNGLLAFLEYVVMVHKGDRGESFVIERPEKFGGNAEYDSFKKVKADFKAEKIHPLDLKKAVAKEVNALLGPVRKRMKGKEKLVKEAYPDEVA